MSGSNKDTQDDNVENTDCTMKMSFDPSTVEVTQKISVDHAEVVEEGRKKKIKVPEEKTSRIDISSSVLGKSIFSRKFIPDDFVKSSTVLSTINSIPPLEENLQLRPVNDNYELKQEFSEGAQGVIRTAFDKSLKRDIVIKSLKPDDTSEKARESENLFVSEARIMAQLDHPSIIPLYGLHCGSENKLHLAMKHIHGKTLQKYMQDIITLYERDGIEKFDEKRSIINRIEYLIKVCEAVDYAHCKGVIHRDLKPENIMIGNYGEVYVMDWGLACLINPEKFPEDEHLTQTGIHSKSDLVGTPCYIAPELIRGGECSPQSDIFSLGMILFEIITLQRAVPGKSVNEVLKNIVNWNYRPFKHRFLKGALSKDLESIIAKAICEPPSRRYKTAADMAKDLKLYLMREETAARPDNVIRKYIRAMVNHKLITATVILSVLLCLTGLTTYSLYSQNKLMKEQEEREAMLTYFQDNVAQRANKMERIFFYLKTQLANAVNQAGTILSNKTGMPAKVYTATDYKNPTSCPADYTFKPYYGVKLSFEYTVLKLGPGVKITDTLNRRVVFLRSLFKYIMFISDPDFKGMSKSQVKKIIADQGAPLSWIFLGLKNGSMMSYPGKEYAENYDPRVRPWYKKAFAQKHGIIWSDPYKCAITSKIVICCTECVYDESNVFQGVLGMDVSLDYIRANMFNNGTAPGAKEYLLNNKGEIILSSDFDDQKAETDKSNATMLVGEFPFLKEFIRAVKRRKVNFEASKYGRKYMFAINKIPSLGYYYVQQVSRKELLRDWKIKSSYYR